MGFMTAEQMKIALRTIDVTRGERAVLIEMAYAVDDAAPVYSWGRDRLADVLGKQPGSTAAKSAVDRALASLRASGFITLVAKPHRGRRAEYASSVLDQVAHRSERCAIDESGSGDERQVDRNAHRSERGALSRVTHGGDENAHRFRQGMDIGSVRMDTGLSDVPPSVAPHISPTSRVHRDATHDEAGNVDDGSAVEIGDSPGAGSTRRITDEQFWLLRDWHILAGYGVPIVDTERWMRDLTHEQFGSVKQAWMRERDSRGRGTGYDGPESGDPEYEHLTDRGKQWADVGCLPGEMRR